MAKDIKIVWPVGGSFFHVCRLRKPFPDVHRSCATGHAHAVELTKPAAPLRPSQFLRLLNVLPGVSLGDRDACPSMATWLRPALSTDRSECAAKLTQAVLKGLSKSRGNRDVQACIKSRNPASHLVCRICYVLPQAALLSASQKTDSWGVRAATSLVPGLSFGCIQEEVPRGCKVSLAGKKNSLKV